MERCSWDQEHINVPFPTLVNQHRYYWGLYSTKKKKTSARRACARDLFSLNFLVFKFEKFDIVLFFERYRSFHAHASAQVAPYKLTTHGNNVFYNVHLHYNYYVCTIYRRHCNSQPNKYVMLKLILFAFAAWQ